MTVLGAEGLRLPQSLRSFAMTLVGDLKKQTQFIRIASCVMRIAKGYLKKKPTFEGKNVKIMKKLGEKE